MGRIPRSPRFTRRSLVQDTSPRYCKQSRYATSPGQTTSTSTTSHSKFGSIHRIRSQRCGLLHPNGKTMNHRPTDTAIKNNVMLAIGTSMFAPYSILHQRYRLTDHANKTWADIRLDIELIITNNTTGNSRDPIFRNRERNRWDQAPADNRASPRHFLLSTQTQQ